MVARKRRTAPWRAALSALLAVTMALGGMPATALADEAQDVAAIEGGEPVASLPVDGRDDALPLEDDVEVVPEGAVDAVAGDARDIDDGDVADDGAVAAEGEEAAVAVDPVVEEAAVEEAPVEPAGDGAGAAGGSATDPDAAGLSAQSDGLAAQAAKKASVAYRVHRQTYGWEGSWRKNGSVSGTTGQAKRLEGINLKLASKPVPGGIKYRTHIQGIGWQGWRANGRLSGTTGQSRRLEAIQVRLTGSMARRYDVWYRVHAQHYGWMGWARNGQSAGTQGHAYRLEAIQVVLKAKGSKAPAASYKGAVRATKARFKRGPVTISGSGWKIALPEYWRGKVTVKKDAYGSGSYAIYPKGSASEYFVLMTQILTNRDSIDYMASRGTTHEGTGRLGSGQGVDIRMGDDGYFVFLVNLGGGRYLSVSTCHYEARREFMGSYGPSFAQLSTLEDLQSMGKLYYTDRWDYDVPIACLRTIAKRTSVG